MSRMIFDFEDGDIAFTTSGGIAFDSEDSYSVFTAPGMDSSGSLRRIHAGGIDEHGAVVHESAGHAFLKHPCKGLFVEVVVLQTIWSNRQKVVDNHQKSS